jgi:hypothetical protein
MRDLGAREPSARFFLGMSGVLGGSGGWWLSGDESGNVVGEGLGRDPAKSADADAAHLAIGVVEHTPPAEVGAPGYLMVLCDSQDEYQAITERLGCLCCLHRRLGERVAEQCQ